MDFNKIKAMGLEYAEKGKNAAMDLAEKGKTQALLVNEQGKLLKAQRQLGALVYSLAKGKEENQPLVDKYIEMIDTIEQEITRLKATLTPAEAAEVEPIDLVGGVCIVEGIHALNPELTGLVPDDQIYRIYAGLREEYCIDGRRVINTQDIRLCRRTLRDAAARGRSPAKTLSMWDRVLDGETRYIKGFKTTADFLLDTSFTYELGLISRLLGEVRRQFTLEGHNAELWDETARRFEQVDPLPLELLPADSMLREFYGSRA